MSLNLLQGLGRPFFYAISHDGGGAQNHVFDNGLATQDPGPFVLTNCTEWEVGPIEFISHIKFLK